jgi:hypothetical protein
VNAALGLGRVERKGRELMGGSRISGSESRMNMDAGAARGGVSILGAGRTSVVVRVANLALGTTAEDVVVSLFTYSSCPSILQRSNLSVVKGNS